MSLPIRVEAGEGTLTATDSGRRRPASAEFLHRRQVCEVVGDPPRDYERPFPRRAAKRGDSLPVRRRQPPCSRLPTQAAQGCGDCAGAVHGLIILTAKHNNKPPDGQRFVVARRSGAIAPVSLTVSTNWMAGLKK